MTKSIEHYMFQVFSSANAGGWIKPESPQQAAITALESQWIKAFNFFRAVWSGYCLESLQWPLIRL